MRWDMPNDVRFYLPPALEDKLLKSFDYGHLETFKQYFIMLDVDCSGELSDKEIAVLLESLGIKISDKLFEKLIFTIDLNGNGTIEYDEFCWMMLGAIV